jgi:hypothetical protein
MELHRRQRYTACSWGDVLQSDLQPQGAPETSVTYRREEHVGLHIRGTYGVTLGMLTVRCERRGSQLDPISVAIAETPIVVRTDAMQSNPRRRLDDDSASVEDRAQD